MNILEYAQTIGAEIVIKKHPREKEWAIDLAGFECKSSSSDPMLRSILEYGSSPDHCLAQLALSLRGKILVTNPYSETKRREYNVPESLSWGG